MNSVRHHMVNAVEPLVLSRVMVETTWLPSWHHLQAVISAYNIKPSFKLIEIEL